MQREDPRTYHVVQVYDGERFLMDFEFDDRLEAIREEQKLWDLGFKTRRMALSTAPLFGTPPDEEFEVLLHGERFAY